MSTNRGALKYYIFTIITFGIYALVVWSKFGKDINTAHEGGPKQMHFILALLLGCITFGIVTIVWLVKLIIRTYNIANKRGTQTYGSVAFIIVAYLLLSWTFIFPIIAMSKLCKTANYIGIDYNQKHANS